MAFDSLSERLQGTLKKVSGQGRLTEKNMEEMLSEIRLALLEADVNFQVVKEFITATKEKALGQDVLGSLKPGQVVVKIVHDELVSLLGTSVAEVDFDDDDFKYEVKIIAGMFEYDVDVSAIDGTVYKVEKEHWDWD